MRARIVLEIIDEGGMRIATEPVADLKKAANGAEDLGLSLTEAKALLAATQQHLVEAQVALWLQEQRKADGRRLRSKGSYPVTFRTLFGDVRLKSPRYCLPADKRGNGPATISPLTRLLPDHIAPERLYLEAKWASLVSYAAASELMADVLPIDSGTNATTVRQHALRAADRLERELTEERVSFMQDSCPRDWANLPIPEGRVVIGLDGGYVRDWGSRKKNFELIVGRSLPEDRDPRYIGFVHGYDRKPQRRILDHLKKQGVQANQDITLHNHASTLSVGAGCAGHFMRRETMDLFVGLDVSKDMTAICARRGDGSIVLACKTETEPAVIASALFALDGKLSYVVLETGRMANWLYDELSKLGIPIVCVDARQAHAVLSQMHNKTDENDAAMLAELARTGFYKQVAVKSRQGQERRALLRAREVAMKTRVNLENTIRGLLSSFGVRLPKHPRTFAGRVLAAIEGAASLDAIIRPLVMIRADAMRGLAELDKALRRAARDDEAARRLMSIPGVGAVSAFAFVATIDDPTRFRSSRSVGAYLGLSAKRHQSGERDISPYDCWA